MSTTTALPRSAVRLQLQALKAPLSLAQRFVGSEDGASWPPMLAFERFEATVKSAWGTVLRDEELSTEARLLHARVSKAHEAADLRARAQEVREQGRAEAAEREAAAERLREQGERADARAEAEAEARAEAEERRIAQEAREAEAEARAEDEDRRRAVAATERTAQRIALGAESSALDEQAGALHAERVAESLDKALERKKAARKRS